MKAEKRGTKWRKRIFDYTDSSGKKHYRSFSADTKPELEKLIAEYILRKDRGLERLDNRRITLSDAIDSYITAKSEILSPSTIRGYRYIQRKRFTSAMSKPLTEIKSWQLLVNHEAATCSAKTVKNAFGFIQSIYKWAELPVPHVTLPQVVKHPLPYLTAEQIPLFLAAIHGKHCEMLALLALHSLRRSEAYAMTKANCTGGVIRVRGSMVIDSNNKKVYKITNKNTSSNRDIPIMIPRLQELLDEAPDGLLVKFAPDNMRVQINKACKEAGLPCVGIHGLRRSFASVGYKLLSERELMRLGGWSDLKTMHGIYVQLSHDDELQAGNKLKNFFGNLV